MQVFTNSMRRLSLSGPVLVSERTLFTIKKARVSKALVFLIMKGDLKDLKGIQASAFYKNGLYSTI